MAKHAKLDLYKQFKSEYVTPKDPVFVVVGPAQYLSITGRGAPGGDNFRAHVGALYTVAFTLKMAEKLAGHDYKVCHLEGQWWTDDGSDFRTRQPKEWQWRLLIRVPGLITQKELDDAIETVVRKKKEPLPTLVTIEKLTEGRCVQMLHVGPYAEEKTAVTKMEQMVQREGLHLHGPHHEIYLSDPNRVPSQRLRTIVRYPVE
jgi:hypothetical protein